MKGKDRRVTKAHSIHHVKVPSSYHNIPYSIQFPPFAWNIPKDIFHFVFVAHRGNRSLHSHPGDSRNKTRPAKVVVVANSKQKCSVRTHNVVKYTSKNFGYDYTLY